MLSAIYFLEHLVLALQGAALVYAVRYYTGAAMVSVFLLSVRWLRAPLQARHPRAMDSALLLCGGGIDAEQIC